MITNYLDTQQVNPTKYVDFFGFSDDGSIKNVKINKMLALIESLYDGDAMPDITQIMVWWQECSTCEKSMPYWAKMTKALTSRLRKYTFMTVEMNESIEIGGYSITGSSLFKKYGGKGVPIFLQDFEARTVMKRRGETKEKKELVRTDFHIVSEGLLQPFMFLAKSFDIDNIHVDTGNF
jgi:hypothetical protein